MTSHFAAQQDMPMDIPAQQQISAMLNGTLPVLLRDRGMDPERVDLRKFITVDRDALSEYLAAHPDEAAAYFSRHEMSNASHDVARLSRDGDAYVTCWMDHGAALSVRRFATLNEAVAEHVLMSHGMY